MTICSLTMMFFRLSGCGVVVAQEPSKLLGPVRTWSAAPDKSKEIFLKTNDALST